MILYVLKINHEIKAKINFLKNRLKFRQIG